MSDTTFYYNDGTISTSSDDHITKNSYNNEYIKLIGVSIGYGVSSLDANCFNNCYNLNSVLFQSDNIHDMPLILGENCFENCSSLFAIELPIRTSVLNDYCFQYCYNLKSIIFPETISFIGNKCFLGCIHLTSVIFENQNNLITVGNDNFFGDRPMNVTYYNTYSELNLSWASKELKKQFPIRSTFNYFSDYIAPLPSQSSPQLLIPYIERLGFTSCSIDPPYILIYVYGYNFRDYSFVTFGELPCQTIYNNSNLLGFYIPQCLPSKGLYSVIVNNANQNPAPGVPNDVYLASNSIKFMIT